MKLAHSRKWLLGVVVALGLLGIAGYAIWLKRRVPDSVIAPIETIAGTLRQRLGKARTVELLQACAERSCSCVETAARAGLDAEPKSVLTLLDAVGQRCDGRDLPAMRVEANARVGKWQAARKEAEAISKREPKNAFAAQALAYSYFVEGNMQRARELAISAEQNSRGAAAPMLIGLAALRQRDLSSAADAFLRALKLEATDTDARYNYGLAMQESGRFMEPREAYLLVLRQRPDYHEARYNLCVLLHSAGALSEAEHHLQKLEQARPGSSDVARLRALLATPPRKGAIPLPLVTPSPGPSPSPSPSVSTPP